MELFHLALIVATLLCSLVAGFVFAFAVVAMPGIRNLGDREFLQAFRAMDRVIQNNQPIFILVWVGSTVVLVVSAVIGIWQLDGADRILIIVACVLYLAGVQTPTATINIPLNKHVQSLDPDAMSESDVTKARQAFEARWNRWNIIRTVMAIITSGLMMVLLNRL